MEFSTFTTQNMSDLLYNTLSTIKDDGENKTEVTLQIPTVESIFPCRLINTPLESTTLTQNAIPIQKLFQVTIEHWASKQRDLMYMGNLTDTSLRELNFVRTNTSPIIYDDITKKYRLIVTYEVRYNAITHSFEFIR